MTSHAHTWTPIPGERGRYRCDCSALGWRDSHGSILVYRDAPPLRLQLTARPTCGWDGRRAAWVPEDYDAGRERDA